MAPQYSAGLKLIAVGYEAITPVTEGIDHAYNDTVTVEVPPNTKHVHVSVIALDMTFGTFDDRKPQSVASIVFGISEQDYSRVPEGKFSFNVKAVLQNKPSHDHTGPWSGRFNLEFLCFG